MKWKNPDVSNDGWVDVDDFYLVGKAVGTTDTTYDLNRDGIVDQEDVEFVARYLGQRRPLEEELPDLPDIYYLQITLLRLPWFSLGAFEGAINAAIVAPVAAVASPLGYEWRSYDVSQTDGTVVVRLKFYKYGSPALPALALGAIAVGILLGIGLILVGISLIYQARVEETKTTTKSETEAKLAELLEKGLITQQQYVDLMAKLQEAYQSVGGDFLGNIGQWLPLILLGLGAIIILPRILPRGRD